MPNRSMALLSSLFDGGLRWAQRKWQLPAYRYAVWTAVWIHLALQLAIWLPLHWGNITPHADWPIYYQAAQRVNEGQSPYQNQPDWGPNLTPHMYLYPPPFTATIAPLGRLEPQQFTVFWYSLLFVSHWIFAWSLAALSRHSSSPTLLAVLVWGVVVQCFPGHRGVMSIGNVQPVVNALWGLSLLGIAGSGRRGMMLTVATCWKLQPLWALVLAVRHERTTRFSAMWTLAIYGLFGAWTCGLASYADWWRHTNPIVNQGTFNTDNFSLNFALLRLGLWSGAWHYDGGPLPVGPRALMSAVALIAPLCAMWFSRHQSLRLRCALVVSVAVLWSPLCWRAYFPLFLPLFILWWHEAKNQTPQISA